MKRVEDRELNIDSIVMKGYFIFKIIILIKYLLFSSDIFRVPLMGFWALSNYKFKYD